MSEGPERSRKAVDRLLGAQQAALHATSRALDAEGGEPERRYERPGSSKRLKAAPVNVQNILEDGA